MSQLEYRPTADTALRPEVSSAGGRCGCSLLLLRSFQKNAQLFQILGQYPGETDSVAHLRIRGYNSAEHQERVF